MFASIRFLRHCFAFSSILFAIAFANAQDQSNQFQQLKTVAEISEYQATSTEAEVESFLKRLDQLSVSARLDRIGVTNEGRPLHSLVVGGPKGLDLPLAPNDDRLVVILLGNIHSGECDGKEALLALARDVLEKMPPLWQEKLVLAFIPNFNADGNERVGLLHRAGQVGPARGMGLRENAQNLDLNRDFIKLETPEVRSLVLAIDHWKADVLIDAHTTNGSLHRYPLTYDIPHNPATPAPITQWLRKEWVPEVTRRMKQQGLDTFYYGNFDGEHKKWEGYGYEPRYSTEYMGLRGRIGILSESYSYATYKERVEASYKFIRTSVDLLAEHHADLKKLFAAADARMVQDKTPVSIQAELSKETESVEVLGYTFPTASPTDAKPSRRFPSPADKGRIDTLVKTTFSLQLDNRYQSKLDLSPPEAYLIPTTLSWAAERLRLHGIAMQRLDDLKVLSGKKITQYEVTNFSQESFQGLKLNKLSSKISSEPVLLQGSYFVVSTRQPLGSLACYLLEPQSDESLACWKFLDGFIEKGKPYPILRLERTSGVNDAALPNLAKVDRPLQGEKLTLEGLYEPGKTIPLSNGPLPNTRWLKESEEYLIEKNNAWFAVEAATGAMRPFDRVKRLNDSLAKLEAFADPATRRSVAKIEALNSDYSMGLVEHQNDLYLYDSRDDQSRQLTHSPQVEKKHATLSPRGDRVAYIQGNNLFVVDCKSTEVRQITSDGSSELLNGVLDWVYQEEVYGRGNFQAFWFSPDGSKLAFLQLNEKPVDRYMVSDSISVQQTLEETRYPKSGAPMPTVKLFVADLEQRKTKEMNLSHYAPDDLLICRIHWNPESRQLFAQIQNRIQTKLDLVQFNPESGEASVLFTEKGPAWIDVIGEPHWLPSGDFLWLSDLPAGRRHLYKVSSDGKSRKRLTDGDWDVEKVVLVDKGGTTAWVTGNPGNRVQVHLVRVDLEKGEWKTVTTEAGTHRVTFHSSGKYFADAFSSITQQPRVQVCNSEGALLRTIVSPTIDRVSTLELSTPKLFTIPARDGLPLQSMLWSSSKVDLETTKNRYPVLIHVYGGPHNPTVKNLWPYETNPWHPYLAQNGIVVLQCDNRSARGRGNADTWTIYKDLGRVELQDLEDAVAWLKTQPWVDPERIGIWGWSYGGYFTAYAMTHTKLFRAGIAGAPVTDWKNYDSIYTERYMDVPKSNEQGYKSSSVVDAAGQLKGRLFIIHGERDDNVHMSNALQLVYALQKAGKPFDFMVYPKNRHGIVDPEQKSHMQKAMTEFLMKHLVE